VFRGQESATLVGNTTTTLGNNTASTTTYLRGGSIEITGSSLAFTIGSPVSVEELSDYNEGVLYIATGPGG
jgi:uncharacterized protein (DUF39 family)